MKNYRIKGYTKFYQSLVKEMYKRDYNKYHSPLIIYNTVEICKQDELTDVNNLLENFEISKEE